MLRTSGGLRARHGLVFAAFLACVLAVSAKAVLGDKPVGSLSTEEIEEGLQVHAPVLSLQYLDLSIPQLTF